MDKTFQPKNVEEKLYNFWEKKGYFKAKANKEKKPFTIILPPPNANADLHMGHAMYVFEDIMIRYHKLLGEETLWLPGADHAGFETQFVFEKKLQKEDKSRFDFDRETLYKLIWDFVEENKGKMENQLRRLGFSLDWSRYKFTLDPDIIKIVYKTFKRLHDEGLIYRDMRLVNYCVNNGTSFSDLEVVSKEEEGLLYFIKYEIEGGGAVEVATTRPETFFGDVALAVNPNDNKNKHLVGKKAILPIIKRKIPIIEDEFVDPKFGTGVVKITPAHDFNDFEVGRKHKLPILQIIGFDGRIQNTNTQYDGLKVSKAREKIIEELKPKTKKHLLVVRTCYKCGRALEPLPLEQWYVKVKPLTERAARLVSEGKIKIYPAKFKKILLKWLEDFHDWNISRQIVWGIRIPAWKCEDCGEWVVTSGEAPAKCPKCNSNKLKQDEDTFDTWFSSSQWPFATLQTLSKEDFEYFYPTSVMETGYDILPWWVARMIMVDHFVTGEIPFQTVFLHGLVRDKQGQKMSKSRGNVINPMDMVEKYGADSLRAALVFGTREGNDLSFTEERVVGMRNFSNKIWNIGRFIESNLKQKSNSKNQNNKTVVELTEEFEQLKKNYFKQMNSYRFAKSLEDLYEFTWHRFADFYIEELKESVRDGSIESLDAMKSVYLESLKLLHPFMPYLTESVWQVFKGQDTSILEERI